jgi:hypothetical protein
VRGKTLRKRFMQTATINPADYTAGRKTRSEQIELSPYSWRPLKNSPSEQISYSFVITEEVRGRDQTQVIDSSQHAPTQQRRSDR